MKKPFALGVLAPMLLVGFSVPASAATKVPTAKVGAVCKKTGTSAKTAKGSALVCKKTGSKLKWALAPKKSADTTIPAATKTTTKKAADTTVPQGSVTTKKAADTTVAKPADTTIPKK